MLIKMKCLPCSSFDRIVFVLFFFHFFFWCEHLVELKNKYPFFGFLHITGIVFCELLDNGVVKNFKFRLY